MIYGVNDIEIILLKLVFIAAVLIPVIPETKIFSITTFPILRILLFPSVLELIKFSTVENLITIKQTGDCNVVYSDCLIGLESWSNILLRNKPLQDNSVMGTLITFNIGRKAQFYISAIGVYTRINQSAQDETTWTAWVKLS